MDYPRTLEKAKSLLQQNHHAQAVQTAASALENLLTELYNQLLGQVPPARQKQPIEAQEKVGGGEPPSRLTLGSWWASIAPAGPADRRWHPGARRLNRRRWGPA